MPAELSAQLLDPFLGPVKPARPAAVPVAAANQVAVDERAA